MYRKTPLAMAWGGAAGSAGSSAALNRVRRQPSPTGTGNSGLVTAAISASRTTNLVAPVALLFDATGTTRTGWTAKQCWRRGVYTFNYGKANAGLTPGNYSYGNASNVSKDADVGGPLGITCYETPGSYTISVSMDDQASSSDSETVSITVQNPDTVYSGTNTVCIDAGGTTGWGPAGATYTSSLPTFQSNKRYLFKNNVSHSSLGSITIPYGVDEIQIGGHGSGTRAVVGQINIGSGAVDTSNQYHTGITIYDVQTPRIYAPLCMEFVTCLRVNFTGSTNEGQQLLYMAEPIPSYRAAAPGNGSAAASYYWPRHFFLVECTLANSSGSGASGGYDWFGYLTQGGAVGCEFGKGYIDHAIRFGLAYKVLLAHNNIYGIDNPVAAKDSLKIHGLGTSAFSSTPSSGQQTQYLIVANNKFNHSGMINQLSVGIKPQNNSSAEGVEDVIVENNTFDAPDTSGVGSPYEISLGGRDILYLGNAAVSGSGVTVGIQEGGHMDGSNTTNLAAWQGPYHTSRST